MLKKNYQLIQTIYNFCELVKKKYLDGMNFRLKVASTRKQKDHEIDTITDSVFKAINGL